MEEYLSKAEKFREWLERTTSFSRLTVHNYFYVVRRFLNQFEDDYSLEDVQAFVNDHYKQYYNGITVRSAMIRFLTFDKKAKWIESIPKLQNRANATGYVLRSDVTLDHIKTLLNYFPEGLHKDILRVQYLTGCRQVEAWLVRKSKTAYRNGKCYVGTVQKGGQDAVLMIADEAKAREVFDKVEYTGKEYYFLPESLQKVSRDTFVTEHYPSLRRAYAREWARACKKAGFQHYQSHDARRALLRAMWKMGPNGPLMAKRQARHQRLDTTAKYADDASDEQIAEALRGVL